MDCDSVLLPLHPRALNNLGKVVQVCNYKSANKHLGSRYTLLCNFGWRVYAQVNNGQKVAISNNISTTGPIIEPSGSSQIFSVGQALVKMETFVNALINAGVTEIVLIGYGLKAKDSPQQSFNLLDTLERPPVSTLYQDMTSVGIFILLKSPCFVEAEHINCY